MMKKVAVEAVPSIAQGEKRESRLHIPDRMAKTKKGWPVVRPGHGKKVLPVKKH